MQIFRDGLSLVPWLGRLWPLLVLLVVFSCSPFILELGARDKDRPPKVRKSRRNGGDEQPAAQELPAKQEGDKPSVANIPDKSTRLGAPETDSKHPLTPAIDALRASRESVRQVPGYACTFIKTERLKKGAMVSHTAVLKFRREPFSVYLKYIEPHAGREVIYVDGRNKGKLLVHEPSGLASVVGTIALTPTCNDAMKENRYPITMMGMEKLLDTAIAELEEARTKLHEVKVQLYPNAKIGEAECTMYEIVSAKESESPKRHKTRIFFDKKTNLPIRTEQYGFPAKAGDEPPLYEEYTYADLKLDVALSDRDFDAKNDSYGFK